MTRSANIQTNKMPKASALQAAVSRPSSDTRATLMIFSCQARALQSGIGGSGVAGRQHVSTAGQALAITHRCNGAQPMDAPPRLRAQQRSAVRYRVKSGPLVARIFGAAPHTLREQFPDLIRDRHRRNYACTAVPSRPRSFVPFQKECDDYFDEPCDDGNHADQDQCDDQPPEYGFGHLGHLL
jgi:hypothetical protein